MRGYLTAQGPNTATITIVIDPSTVPGTYSLSLVAFGVTTLNPRPFSVYDATPQLDRVDPNEFLPGSTTSVTLTGANFGVNPDVLVLPPEAGITVNVSDSTTTTIHGTVSVPDTTPPDTSYTIVVRSRGNSGFGFQPAPGGQSSGESNGQTITIRGRPCTWLTIVEETVSPSTLGPPVYDAVRDSLTPLRNPATIRVGFAPVFEAQRVPANCSITWSVTGPGTIVGSRNSSLVTVRGDTVGQAVLQVSEPGGLVVTMLVDVVAQRTVPIRAVILRNSAGTVAATDEAHVQADVQYANAFWQQAGIQFVLDNGHGGIGDYLDSDDYLDTESALEREALRDTIQNSGGIEVYYVRRCTDIPDSLGVTSPKGVVICIANRPTIRTMAHELGHAMGLSNSGIENLHLMYQFSGEVEGDIRRWEVNSLSTFSSQ